MAMNRLAKGTVVVTGASSGIGEACALYLDKLGFQVFAGVCKEAGSTTLTHKASDRLTPVRIDVTDVSSITSAAEVVANAVGEMGLAGLVNNAGIAVTGPLEFLPLIELRKQLEVNVIGQIAVTQAFLLLLRKGHGRIINMGSISGRIALPFLGPYAASKFALEALTDALRVELRPWGIPVSIVEPGNVATPIWEKSRTAVDEIIKSLSQEAYGLYGPTLVALRGASDKLGKTGIPPDSVAKAVAHALMAKRPKTRYVVGRKARLGATLVRFMPKRVRDWLIARRLDQMTKV